MPFPFALARRGAKPLEPFGKGSNALKAGTPDAGPEGPTVPGALNASTAVRSAPGRGRAEGALYAPPARKGKAIEAKASRSAGGFARPLDQLGEPHRQLDPFADLLIAGSIGSGGFAQLLYAGEQRLHVLAQKLLPECRVVSRAGELIFGDRRINTHGRRLVNNALWRCVIWRDQIIKMRLSLCYFAWPGHPGPAPLTGPGSEYLSPLSPGQGIWRLRSFFRARAARRSAWARGSPRPLRRRVRCSRKSTRHSANGSAS